MMGGSRLLSHACSGVSSRAADAQAWLAPRVAGVNATIAPYTSTISENLSVVDFAPNLAMGELTSEMYRSGIETAIESARPNIKNVRIRHRSGYTKKKVQVWRLQSGRASRERYEENTTSWFNFTVE